MQGEGGSCFSSKVGQANHSTILNASGRIRNAMRERANLFVEAIGLHSNKGGQSHAIIHSNMKPMNNHIAATRVLTIFSVKVSWGK